MSHELSAALIGAGATIVAAVLPLAYRPVRDYFGKYVSRRRGSIVGRWQGAGTDFYAEDPTQPLAQFDVVMNFSIGARTVKARAALTGGAAGDDSLTLLGSFYDDDYLQMSYHNPNRGRKQLGVVVLGLDASGDEMRGYYSGYSPRRKTIVAGKIVLRRKI
jgi:hypothetical protein